MLIANNNQLINKKMKKKRIEILEVINQLIDRKVIDVNLEVQNNMLIISLCPAIYYTEFNQNVKQIANRLKTGLMAFDNEIVIKLFMSVDDYNKNINTFII